MSTKKTLKILVEFGTFREDFEGSPDEVVRAVLASLSRVYPSLMVAQQLVFQPDLTRLVDALVGLVEFAPEGLLLIAENAPSEEAILISLVGSFVGYRLSKIDKDTYTPRDLARTTRKALKTISNQLAWMVDEGLVERVGRGEYRIASPGIKRFEQIAERRRRNSR